MKKIFIFLALIRRERKIHRAPERLSEIDSAKLVDEHEPVKLVDEHEPRDDSALRMLNPYLFVGGIVSHPILSPMDRPPISGTFHPPLHPNPTYITQFLPTRIPPRPVPVRRPGIFF